MSEMEHKDQWASLRTEIVESQKARIDLLKYKLLAVAALGAFGLGAGHGDASSMSSMYIYSFCFIPFVCVYIDLLCFHNTLRILVIGKYLQSACADPYERFISEHLDTFHQRRKGFFFEMEDWALQWSSVALSIILALFGILDRIFWHILPLNEDRIFWLVGNAGIILSVIACIAYKNRVRVLRNCVDRCRVLDEKPGRNRQKEVS
jgi:hypothetical protein